MPAILKTAVDDAGFDAFRSALDAAHPRLRFGRERVDGRKVTLRAQYGGMRVFWVYGGEGEAYLPEGYRTKEGDGQRLPSSYAPEHADRSFLETLAYIEAHLTALPDPVRGVAQAVIGRRRDSSYIGDFANELWKLAHIPKPWTTDDSATRALESLFLNYEDHGYSVKTESSWERIISGDQLIVAGAEELLVRGQFSCFALEALGRSQRHIPSVMRLRYLKDSSGGCNFDFDPFRRLPLTWYWNLPGEEGDGLNFVNSHVVNIAQETSPTHFHPPQPIGGGAAQNEMYLVLDPATYGINTYGRTARLLTFPDLRNLKQVESHSLAPGDLVYIPAGTGHRGMDAFVNVITLPGFKPYNEFYIDQDIFEAAGDTVPSNRSLFHIRNYATIDAVLRGTPPDRARE